MLSAVERTLEKPAVPISSSSCAFTSSGIAPKKNSKILQRIRIDVGAVRTGVATTDANTVSKSVSISPGKCFSSTGPGSAPISLGRFIIASPAAATGADAAGAAGAAVFGGAGAAAGFGAAAATRLAVATSALPFVVGASAPAALSALAAGASAAAPSLRNREGASSGKVVSGC